MTANRLSNPESIHPREGTTNGKKGCTLRKLTLEATLGALLYDIEKRTSSGGDEACLPVRFARRLVAGALWDSREIPSTPLRSVFTHLNGEHPDLYLPTPVQDGRMQLPEKQGKPIPAAEYERIMETLRSHLSCLRREEAELPGLLRLLEDSLCYVPIAGGDSDISLYDRSKITAAIAACVAEYLAERGETDLYSRLVEQEAQFRAEQTFLLYSADFSGIQKFIFTVATKGALPSLRSRSFFLELLMEHYIDELLSACGMSRANLLYSGGGHCYLLLPNTPGAEDALKQWNTRFNDWLAAQFGIQLFIAHGRTSCSGNALINTPAAQAPYTAMFRRVSAAIASHKLHRYSASRLRKLNAETANSAGRECVVCGRSDRLGEKGRCAWCDLFVELSGKVLGCPVYLVSGKDSGFDFALPGWDGTRYVTLTNENTACTRLRNGEAVVRIYTKNRAFPGLPNATRLSVGDHAASRQLADLAANAKGITRLAVCRMDVDDLGHAFVAGYRKPDETDPKKRDEYLNISRTSAFSRQMSLFFKCHINPILAQPAPDGSPLSVAIVYSGGDDVFLVGAWNDVITAALRIQSSFAAFCGGALTISAGISLHEEHFPIRQAAAHSAALEERAKQTPGKNAVALFDPEENHTYSWQEFREKVIAEKGKALNDFFHAADQERGNAFLYQLLELLRQAQEDKINLARYAYLLAKLEPKEKDKQERYRAFSGAMYRWALSAQDRRQLITAIYLYIYTERKAT